MDVIEVCNVVLGRTYGVLVQPLQIPVVHGNVWIKFFLQFLYGLHNVATTAWNSDPSISWINRCPSIPHLQEECGESPSILVSLQEASNVNFQAELQNVSLYVR